MDIKQSHRLSPEYVLLGFLYEHPNHGYELHRRLLGEFGYIWRISQSQTYNILKRLERQGYIKSNYIEQEKLPARQLLCLTETGLQRFNTWLNTPTKCSVHAIRVEFITRLYFFQQYYPQKIQETIRVQSRDVQLEVVQLEEMRANLSEAQTFNRLALDMRIKLLTAIVSWLDEYRVAFASNSIKGDDHN
jgi:DNA-binding PadR family transcriptional regulator